MIDVVEILQHWHAGRPKAEVGASLGVDRGTVRKYVAKAEAAGFVPGDRTMTRDDWRARVCDWFPELVDAKARSLTFGVIDAHRERIEMMLETNTVTTVWQRLRDEHGLAAGISSFRRYVWLEFPERPTAARVTVPRPEIDPGDEAQIDFGYLGPWFDPALQRVRRVWAFVMVLAASRHMFVRPVFRMDQQSWTAAHVAAFEFFGGVPARLVPDNLKAAVDRPDLYDPKINRAYAELAAHYDCLVDPARALKPKDKQRRRELLRQPATRAPRRTPLALARATRARDLRLDRSLVNPRRRHSYCGMLSPIDYETATAITIENAA